MALDDSIDLVTHILAFVEPSNLPHLLSTSRTFHEVGRPLLQASVFFSASRMHCSFALKEHASVPTRVDILRDGSCAVLFSAIDGNGQLEIFKSSGIVDVKDVPPNRAIAAFAETTAEVEGRIVAVVVSRDAGEEDQQANEETPLEYGAELHIWDKDESQPSTKKPLGHSEFICGEDPLALSTTATPTIFKSRATHIERSNDSGDGYLRTLVHNPSLAADKSALLAAFSLSSGELLPSHCRLISWSDEENISPPQQSPNAAASGEAPNRHRFGGVACASVFIRPSSAASNSDEYTSAVIATGHNRDADGIARARLWDARTGAVLGTFDGPQLPVKGFSTAGVTRVAVSGHFYCFASVDGNVRLYRRPSSEASEGAQMHGGTEPVAILSPAGVLSPEVAGESGGGGSSRGNAPKVESIALEGNFLIAAFSCGKRYAREAKVVLFRLDSNTEHPAVMCGVFPLQEALKDHKGMIKVNSIGSNLEHSGKVILACSYTKDGSSDDASVGLTLTFDFLAAAPST